jgi:hypothetical protein
MKFSNYTQPDKNFSGLLRCKRLAMMLRVPHVIASAFAFAVCVAHLCESEG